MAKPGQAESQKGEEIPDQGITRILTVCPDEPGWRGVHPNPFSAYPGLDPGMGIHLPDQGHPADGGILMGKESGGITGRYACGSQKQDRRRGKEFEMPFVGLGQKICQGGICPAPA